MTVVGYRAGDLAYPNGPVRHRPIGEMEAEITALLDQRDTLQTRVNELTYAFINHRTETHTLKSTYCETCRKSDAVLQGA